MSRKNAMSDNRCPVCGGRMKLVNVTWVNRFCTPEATQYDLSVSRRQSAPITSAQEMMCFSCSRRLPLSNKKDSKKVKAEKPIKNTYAKNTAKNTAKKNKGSGFGTFLFIVILLVSAYFAYTYSEVVLAFLQPVIDFFTNLFQK